MRVLEQDSAGWSCGLIDASASRSCQRDFVMFYAIRGMRLGWAEEASTLYAVLCQPSLCFKWRKGKPESSVFLCELKQGLIIPA